MKFNLSIVLLLVGLFCSSSLFGQAFILKFEIWKKDPNNGPDIPMGIYERVVSASPNNYGNSAPFNLSEPICPGDQLVFKNLCQQQLNGNIVNHSFTGSSTNPNPGSNPTYNKLTLGLTNKNHCSPQTPPLGPGPAVDILHLADVGAYNSSLPTHQSWNNWNYGAKKTVTITPASPLNPTGNVYLAISAGQFGNHVHECGCGNRYFFMRMNLKEGVDPIGDREICPDDVVNLNLNTNYTYTNWSPNNPNGSTLSATTGYTVDVVNNSTGCTLRDEFTIQVNQPATELITQRFLCYNQSYSLDLNNDQGLITSAIQVNGEVVYDLIEGVDRLPFPINSQSYGVGAVNIQYTYWVNNNPNQTCTKTYQLIIDDPITIDVPSPVSVCINSGAFICASTPAQQGITYTWSQGALPVAFTNCFTPSFYGMHHVAAHRASTGCHANKSVQVVQGVGIDHPGDISFCSLTSDETPAFVGWASNPFSPTETYGITWTYLNPQSVSGTPVTIPTSSVSYQVPYMGEGTYTASVTLGNGCSQTFTIIVQDLFQIFYNHPYAQFTTVQSGSTFSHYPTTSVQGGVESWSVVDASGANVAYSINAGGYGISYISGTGSPYEVTLTIMVADSCTVYTSRLQGRRSEDNSQRAAFDQVLDVQVFPNPTTGTLTIQLGDVVNHTSVRVLNSLGQVLLTQDIHEQSAVQLDVSELAAGLYQVEVFNETARTVKTVVKK